MLFRSMLAAAALMGATAGLARAADVERGRDLYAACQACHSLDGEDGVGPSLKGIVGRRAGSVAGFRYSPAMRRSTLVWDLNNLDQFMQDPQAALRGTRMPFEGIPDASERADIAAFLATQR